MLLQQGIYMEIVKLFWSITEVRNISSDPAESGLIEEGVASGWGNMKWFGLHPVGKVPIYNFT